MSRAIVMMPLVFAFLGSIPAQAQPKEMPSVRVSRDQKGFVLEPSGRPFVPWGFNYDRDDTGRLLEDHWEAEWATVEAHFTQMKKLGANVVRVHLQLGKFMDGPDKPNGKALDRLSKLLQLVERLRLYLDLTGLGCYHKKDVPTLPRPFGRRTSAI
jgi:aryl-phospho-beta-D-glucosidase BglC (GH1 family)